MDCVKNSLLPVNDPLVISAFSHSILSVTLLSFTPSRQIPVAGDSRLNIPWENEPPGQQFQVWRLSTNPVIGRSPFPECNSVSNLAVVPFQGKFAEVFRCDSTEREMQLHAGFSDDGIAWKISPKRIEFAGADPKVANWDYGYDPRVVWIHDRYCVTWCNGYHSPAIGMAWTMDFETFHQLENAFLPYNRNGVPSRASSM